jgi:hypothetical protein
LSLHLHSLPLISHHTSLLLLLLLAFSSFAAQLSSQITQTRSHFEAKSQKLLLAPGSPLSINDQRMQFYRSIMTTTFEESDLKARFLAFIYTS